MADLDVFAVHIKSQCKDNYSYILGIFTDKKTAERYGMLEIVLRKHQCRYEIEEYTIDEEIEELEDLEKGINGSLMGL